MPTYNIIVVRLDLMVCYKHTIIREANVIEKRLDLSNIFRKCIRIVVSIIYLNEKLDI